MTCQVFLSAATEVTIVNSKAGRFRSTEICLYNQSKFITLLEFLLTWKTWLRFVIWQSIVLFLLVIILQKILWFLFHWTLCALDWFPRNSMIFVDNWLTVNYRIDILQNTGWFQCVTIYWNIVWFKLKPFLIKWCDLS